MDSWFNLFSKNCTLHFWGSRAVFSINLFINSDILIFLVHLNFFFMNFERDLMLKKLLRSFVSQTFCEDYFFFANLIKVSRINLNLKMFCITRFKFKIFSKLWKSTLSTFLSLGSLYQFIHKKKMIKQFKT